MNRRSPTQLSEKASYSALNQTVTFPIHLVTYVCADTRAKISSSGCFPAAASTRHGKRSPLNVSHGRVSFGHYPFGEVASPRAEGVASTCASGLPGGPLSLSRTADELARRLAQLQIDHEQCHQKNDVLTRSVDALPARVGVWLNQALCRTRVFHAGCISRLLSIDVLLPISATFLRLWSEVWLEIVKYYYDVKIDFAPATQNGDNFRIRLNSILLIDVASTEFMVAFHRKRSFPARKSTIFPGGAYRAIFLSPLSAPTAFPLVRGASACSSFPARQASPASRAFFLPKAITRSLLNAHRSIPAAPTHTRNTQ